MSMTKLSDLIPLNLEEEKAKFFASNFTYNPQFVYQKNTPSQELEKYGKPKWLYLLLAQRILNKYLKNKEQIDSLNTDKNFLQAEELEKIIKERLAQYQLENDYQVIFSQSFVSRIAVNNSDRLIKVSLPVTIERGEVEQTLNHEIDTHVIRQLNYEKQPWFKHKKKNKFKKYLTTEEGLAAINELVASEHKLAYKSATNYLAVNLALKKDFASVFKFFYEISGDKERSWTWTLKKKRGIRDTSQKGAFTKDLVYFEGFVKVLGYLRRNNFDPSKLYYGKIDQKDIKRAEKIGVSGDLILPVVYRKNPQAYKENIKKIIKNNFLKMI